MGQQTSKAGSRKMWVVAPRPGQFNPGKDTVSIVQETVWASGPIWTDMEYLASDEVRSRTVQPVASRFPDS
jgi:hypothetical protein